jgi:hypothetical protein
VLILDILDARIHILAQVMVPVLGGGCLEQLQQVPPARRMKSLLPQVLFF